MSKKLGNAMNLYLEGIRDGHYVEAVNKYTGARYTQHSTGVKDGKDGFIEFFGPFVERNPDRDIQIIRKLVDGPKVFLQAYQNINKGEAEWVTTDFFDTDEDDRIIEHWDVIAEYCGNTASGHTTVDGSVELRDPDKTEENKILVQNFLKDVYMPDGNPGKLDTYVSRAACIQHSRDTADGFDTLAARVQAPDRALNYQDIVLTVGQGNFVATLSRATWTEDSSVQEICQVDIFRIENGLIVEHWENRESVPETDVNGGKF